MENSDDARITDSDSQVVAYKELQYRYNWPIGPLPTYNYSYTRTL